MMAVELRSPNNDVCFLCPAAGCINNDPSLFEERYVCGDTEESAEVMVCLLCNEECLKDEWNFTKEALGTDSLDLHYGSLHDKRTRTFPSGSQATDPASTGNDATTNPMLTNQYSSSALPNFPSVYNDISVPENTDNISTDYIHELFSASQCLECQGTLSSVPGIDNVWYCDLCDNCTGLDDSMSISYVYGLIDILADSFEHATLRTDQCPGGCGNNDLNKIEFDKKEGDLRCMVCGYLHTTHDTPDTEQSSGSPHSGRTTTEHPEIGILNPSVKGRTEIHSIHQLAPGDHIKIHRTGGYWHHMIVSKVDKQFKQVDVIEYTSEKRKKKGPTGKVLIKKSQLEWDHCKEPLYRVDYNQSLPTKEVLRRAESRIGESKYSPFINNCEHFATWCKTGKKLSSQVESLKRAGVFIQSKMSLLSVKEELKAIMQIAKSGAGSFKFDTFKNMAKASVKSIGVLDFVGMALVLPIEAVRTGLSIYRMHQKMVKGDISRTEYKRFKAKRSCQGIGAAAGTILGGILGQILIPIPLIGNLVGSTLGSFLFEALGVVMGRQVIRHKAFD